MKRIEVDEEIVIREWTVADARVVFDLVDANRRHLRRWEWWWVDNTRTVDDAKTFLENATSAEALARTLGGLVEFHGAAVGVLNLRGLDSPHRMAEFGYWLAEEAQGKGIITRGCRALIDIAFREHGIHRIVIVNASDNVRSRAVAERLGFTMEGCQRERFLWQGRFCDAAVYSLLEQEWPLSARDAKPRPATG